MRNSLNNTYKLPTINTEENTSTARLGLSPLSKALSMRRALNINLLPSALALAVSLPVAGHVQAQEIELTSRHRRWRAPCRSSVARPCSSAVQSDRRGRQKSTAVKGKLEPQQAINALLAGTSTTHSLSGSSLTVTAAGTTAGLELSPTQVTANQLGNVTENTGSYTPGSIATATRLVLTPKETPQSVTVVTRQHMDDFGLNNVDDVMRHTPASPSRPSIPSAATTTPVVSPSTTSSTTAFRPLRATWPTRRATP
jgi:outer membrane receptor for ferric coprogen and ferric-rhodotorulic acid